jgi:hypothetical protein
MMDDQSREDRPPERWSRGGANWKGWRLAGRIDQDNVGLAVQRIESLPGDDQTLLLEMGQLIVAEGAAMTVLVDAIGDLSRRRPIVLNRPPRSLVKTLEGAGHLEDAERIRPMNTRDEG